MKNFYMLSVVLMMALAISFPCFSLHAQQSPFNDTQFAFEFKRTMGYSSTGGADIAECLYTASQITDGDIKSWYEEWNKTAERLEKAGDEFFDSGHEISAKEAWFRASNYYRTAEFFLHTDPDDPRIMKTWGKSRFCFLKAIPFAGHPIKYVRIPFEGTTLPAYLCLVDKSGLKRPLLIIHSGFDGTAEELYFEIAKLAVERGFNCLLFEGPGQGEMIRKQKIPFRPDWETVVTPVVDFALDLTEVDPDRVGLMGISFGGYLAPRAAAFEDRIKVCIPNGGIYDFYENVLKKCPPEMEEILADEKASKDFDKVIVDSLLTNPDIGWSFANGMFTFGAKTPSDFIRKLKPYHMRDCAAKIKCKLLVVDSEEDAALPGQARQLFDALECPKEFMLFTKEEGAEEHCQMGAIMISGERILNWLVDELME